MLTVFTQFDLTLNLDVDKKKSLQSLFHRIQDAFRKSKKSIANPIGEYGIMHLLYVNFEAKMKSTHDRKYLIDLTLEQQRCRISCVLKSIKLLSKIEDISEIQIALSKQTIVVW